MNIVKNGYIVDNYNNSLIKSVSKEKYNKLLLDYSIDELYKIFNSQIIIPVFRFYLLDYNENIVDDLSMDLINGSLSVTYQTGKRRTFSSTLINNHGRYTPTMKNMEIYLGSKFRFDAGVLIGDTIHWFQQGIFLLTDPSHALDGSSETISFSLHDKFANLDGTVNGTTYLKTIVPEGVPIKQAFSNMLWSDSGNGYPFDSKTIIFNSKYENELTCKTLRQEENTKLGDIFTDYGSTICSDVYYNVFGNMVVENNINEFLDANLPVIWRFKDGDRLLRNCSMTYNWSKLRNKIIVKGAITNGYQFSASAQNNNPMSIYNVTNSRYGMRPETITDNKLYSDTLCEEKAKYVLVERQRGVKSLNLNVGFLPFFDVNKSVLVSLEDYDLRNTNFVIDSFSMSASSEPNMSIGLSNLSEVIFE